MTTLYGIKNCDTIKKAKKWLTEHNIDFQFHDYRVDGLDEAWLKEITTALGWENLLNKRGTTFRQLPEEQKQGLNEEKAVALMLNSPAMIKRPLLSYNDTLTLGFKAAEYEKICL